MKNIVKNVVIIVLLMGFVMTVLPVNTILAASIPPSIYMTRPSVSSVDVGGTVSYTVNYVNAEEISLSRNDIRLIGFTANVSISGSGTSSRTVTLSNIQGSAGSKSISIASGTGSNDKGDAGAIGQSIGFDLKAATVVPPVITPERDSVRPSIGVKSPNPGETNIGGTISYTVMFADNVGVTNVSLNSSHITLNGFTANIGISGNGNTRTITLSNIQGAVGGSKNISIAGGVARDAAGNSTSAVYSTSAFTLKESSGGGGTTPIGDSIRPSTGVKGPNPARIYAGEKVVYTVIFADNVGIAKINLSKDHVKLNGFTADIDISGSGNTRTITLSNIQGAVGGDKYISLAGGAAEDAAGNRSDIIYATSAFTIVDKANPENPSNPNPPSGNTGSGKDDEPKTGVESLPILPIMGSAVAILTTAGYVIVKRIYG